MEARLMEITQRIRELREILGLSEEMVAEGSGVSLQEYQKFESGQSDFTFTFLYRCAQILGVDLVELITGEQPRLSFYSIIRKGKGLPIKRIEGFTYQHLAYLFKGKLAEPFLVTAPFREEEQEQPIPLYRHKGQEFDYILKGRLKVAMEDHIEVLEEGDAIYYDSGKGHGMIATGGDECVFLAMVLKGEDD